MGLQQSRPAGSREGCVRAAVPCPGVLSHGDTSYHGGGWRDPHPVHRSLRSGLLLRGQQTGPTGTQQSGREGYSSTFIFDCYFTKYLYLSLLFLLTLLFVLFEYNY